MGHPKKTFIYLEIIGLSNLAYMISITNPVDVDVEIFRIENKLFLEK